jgi:hypothetical protein
MRKVVVFPDPFGPRKPVTLPGWTSNDRLSSAQLAGKHGLEAGRHAATPLAYVLAVLICAPFSTHRKWPLSSLAVCLAALLVYSVGRYTAYPGLSIFALIFGISLHSSRRLALVTVIASAVALTVALGVQPPAVRSLSTWVESELGVVAA